MQSTPFPHWPLIAIFLAATIASTSYAVSTSSTDNNNSEIRTGAETFFDAAAEILADEPPIAFCPKCPAPFPLRAEFLRELDGGRFAILVPRNVSNYDIRFQVFYRDQTHSYESLSIRSQRNEDHSLMITSLYSRLNGNYDYFLSLEIGPGFESRGKATLQGNRVFNWAQNSEYRLLVISAPTDPSDPRFSLILQDELLVNIESTPVLDRTIPSIRPNISIRPANLGISMAVGQQSRLKVSVGGGFALSMFPFSPAQSATQGFFRLQFRP